MVRKVDPVAAHSVDIISKEFRSAAVCIDRLPSNPNPDPASESVDYFVMCDVYPAVATGKVR